MYELKALYEQPNGLYVGCWVSTKNGADFFIKEFRSINEVLSKSQGE